MTHSATFTAKANPRLVNDESPECSRLCGCPVQLEFVMAEKTESRTPQFIDQIWLQVDLESIIQTAKQSVILFVIDIFHAFMFSGLPRSEVYQASNCRSNQTRPEINRSPLCQSRGQASQNTCIGKCCAPRARGRVFSCVIVKIHS